MDKTSFILVCNENFNKEGTCMILHFIDGSNLLINKKPIFFNLHMEIKIEFNVEDEVVMEKCIVPFSSIMYVTVTSNKNLKLISKQYEKI